MKRNGRAWGGLTMAGIAAVAAVISYSDGLFLVRLAGNRDWHAYLYPLLPDGLIVICLVALLAAKGRPAWPTFGLGLGIALTLAMNVAAGLAHSILDAVVDGFVPVVFFVAVEVFIGYVRRGRPAVPPAVPVRAPLPKVREIRARQGCNQETAGKALDEVKLDRRSRGDVSARSPVPAAAPARDAARPPAGALAGASPNGRARG